MDKLSFSSNGAALYVFAVVVACILVYRAIVALIES
jgi:hypothetical protein